MSDLERYQKMKQRAADLRREADRAEGALEQVMKKLKDDFGCKTLKEAEQLQEKLTVEVEEADEKFGALLKDFEDKWGHLLEE
jgi:multidrug resistance efflux pump